MRRQFALAAVLFAAVSGGVAALAGAPSPSPLPTVRPEITAWVRPTDPPSPTASPAPTAPLRVDGAFSLPGGIWACETMGNSPATSVYKLVNSTTILERTMLQLPKRPAAKLESVFRYNPKSASWTVSVQSGLFSGTAPVWSGTTWAFDGLYVAGGELRPVRLVYTSLGDGAMRIDYETNRAGFWRTFSGATCSRRMP
jgi:hypothetical protein